MIRLYLVRHGKTYLNKYERMQGWSDSPLTDDGIQGALQCGQALSEIHFDGIFSSDSGRTIQTAELIKQKITIKDPKLKKLSEWRETFFGSYEGELSLTVWTKVAEYKGFSSLEEMLDQLSMKEVLDAFHNCDPTNDAESYEQCLKRILEGLNKVAALAEEEKEETNLLVVTHGNTIRMIASYLDPEVQVNTLIDNGSVTTIDYSDGVFSLASFNQATNNL